MQNADEEGMNMDIDMIKARLREAAETENRLPKVGHRPLRALWPQIQDVDTYNKKRATIQTEPPTPEAIDRMDECLEWVSWVAKNSQDQARVLWLRAQNHPWKVIVRNHGMSRTWWNNQHQLGLHTIIARLAIIPDC